MVIAIFNTRIILQPVGSDTELPGFFWCCSTPTGSLTICVFGFLQVIDIRCVTIPSYLVQGIFHQMECHSLTNILCSHSAHQNTSRHHRKHIIQTTNTSIMVIPTLSSRCFSVLK